MAKVLTQHRPGVAISLKLSAVFLFMVMAALIKTASDHVPPGQAVFFRSFFALPIIMAWLWQRGQLREGLIPSNLMGHVWRGLFGTSAMGLTFAGLGLLPLPEVTAIGYATPMFAVLFAAIFLGERVRIFRLSAVAGVRSGRRTRRSELCLAGGTRTSCRPARILRQATI